MSELEYKVILQAIEQTCEAHKEGIRGILASIDANAMVTNNELKGMNNHLSGLNGTVAKLQEESDKRKKVVDEFYEHVKHGNHKWVLWTKKNWWAVALIFIGAVIVIFEVRNNFSIKEIWDFFKSIK
jgi:predicted nuclease with TOPRIM domain